MAISANTVHEWRTTGNALNGGGFVTGATGTDYSQQDTAQWDLTGVVGASANVINYASASDDMVGNLLHVASGTNFTSGYAAVFEIISVVVNTSITVSTNVAGASICPGAGPWTAGAIKIGGAKKFTAGGASDDTLLENLVAGNIVYMKAGTYTVSTVNLSAIGTATQPIIFRGYQTTRGDSPYGFGIMPKLEWAASTSCSSYTWWEHIHFNSTNTLNVLGTGGMLYKCMITNNNTTADAIGMSVASSGGKIMYCSFSSTRGYALSSAVGVPIIGCTFHNSKVGIRFTGNVPLIVNSCLFYGNLTHIQSTSGTANAVNANNCTFYGYSSSTPVGVGIDNAAATVGCLFTNNIFYGLSTAITHATASQLTVIENFNTFYGNTTNRTNIPTGANSITLDPGFSSITQRSGATATTAASNRLVQSGATFQTWGITAGTHYVYVASGTGVTVGIYSILSVDSETQITVGQTLAADATADKVWYITTGLDFRVGANMKAVGSPSTFPGASANCISYVDIGAVQRKEDYPVVGDVKTGTVYSNGELTGTQANIVTTGGGSYLRRR